MDTNWRKHKGSIIIHEKTFPMPYQMFQLNVKFDPFIHTTQKCGIHAYDILRVCPHPSHIVIWNMFFMTIKLFYQKHDYITKLSTIVMKFSMLWLQLTTIVTLIKNKKYYLCI
jgi:hypothetical protein